MTLCSRKKRISNAIGYTTTTTTTTSWSCDHICTKENRIFFPCLTDGSTSNTYIYILYVYALSYIYRRQGGVEKSQCVDDEEMM